MQKRKLLQYRCPFWRPSNSNKACIHSPAVNKAAYVSFGIISSLKWTGESFGVGKHEVSQQSVQTFSMKLHTELCWFQHW